MIPTENDRNKRDSSYLAFREPADVDEPCRLFDLHYREYRSAGLGDLVPQNEYGIDNYDLRSYRFGMSKSADLLGTNGSHFRGQVASSSTSLEVVEQSMI